LVIIIGFCLLIVIVIFIEKVRFRFWFGF